MCNGQGVDARAAGFGNTPVGLDPYEDRGQHNRDERHNENGYR
jgi:hypothetical protein